LSGGKRLYFHPNFRRSLARPLKIIYPGAFYHITSKGNQRKEIFKSQIDGKKFLSYLETATRRYDARPL